MTFVKNPQTGEWEDDGNWGMIGEPTAPTSDPATSAPLPGYGYTETTPPEAPYAPTNEPMPGYGYTETTPPEQPYSTPQTGYTWTGTGEAPAVSQMPTYDQAPAAPTGGAKTPVANPLTGEVSWLDPGEVASIEAKYAEMAAEAQRRQAETERMRQFQLDTERVASEGQRAYQEALIKYQNASLAQQAADNAMKNEIERQRNMMTANFQQGQLAMQGAGIAGEQQYRGQMISLQQQQANEARRQRRPFRALRVSVT